MKENSTSANVGGGFTGILTIVFITLKLLGKIDWPWVWVLSPIWISIAIVVIILLVVFLVYKIKGVNFK